MTRQAREDSPQGRQVESKGSVVDSIKQEDAETARRISRFFRLAALLVLVVATFLTGSVWQAGDKRLLASALVTVPSLAVALGYCAWSIRRGRLRLGLALALIAFALASVGLAVGTGRGLNAILLGILGLNVGVASVLIGRRFAQVLVAGSVAALLGLYVAERANWLGSAPALPPETALLSQMLLLGMALLCSWTLFEAVQSSARKAQTRQHRFQALLRIASDGYWEMDDRFRFTQIEGWRWPVGDLPASTMIGKALWEASPRGVAAEDMQALAATLQARKPFRELVISCEAPNESRSYLSLSGEPICDGDGRFAGYWGVGRDVTEEIGAQKALESSERRYRDLFERAPTPLLIHRRGVVIMANRAAAAQFGFADPQAMVGAGLLPLHPPEERDLVRSGIEALEAMPVGGDLAPAELHIPGAGDEPRLVQVSGVRVQLADGPATLSIYFDITERKRAEAALRRSEEMLSKLFDASPDAMCVSELDTGKILLANEHYFEMLGLTRGETIGRAALELGVWDEPGQRRLLTEALAHGQAVRNLPVTLRSRDGRKLAVMVSSAQLDLDGRRLMVSIVRDVTTRERARLLQEAVLKNASVGIAFTRDQVFQLANPLFEEMYGWAPGTIQGQPGRVVWRSEEDYAEIGRIVGPLLARGEPVDLERKMRRRDGSEFWCRIRARVVDPNNPATGGTIWIVEDITEQRAFAQALADAKEGAEAANRAKSAFLANMSHEIRTPLNGVLGLARLTLLAEDDPARRKEYLRRMIESAEALAEIISGTLDLAKIEAGKLTVEAVKFDLQDLVESTCALHREAAIDRGLLLAARFEDGAGRRVLGDPVRIRQILGNYLANAIKFTTRGRIDVAVGRRADGRMRIAVTDTGIGIDEATQARLFQPFSQGDNSTTRRFGGTGLGLSICRSLADLMGGAVGLSSQPGAGSTFWVDLPLPAVAAEPVAPPAPDRALLPLRGVRVLVVEDNAVNMLLAEQMLLHWGAEVAQAANGRQALEAVERADGHFDLVLMDVHMPVMGGHEATAELRRRYTKEELPIVALTAAALVSEREQSLAMGMNDFIAKPIEADRMLDVILRVIGRCDAQTARSA